MSQAEEAPAEPLGTAEATVEAQSDEADEPEAEGVFEDGSEADEEGDKDAMERTAGEEAGAKVRVESPAPNPEEEL